MFIHNLCINQNTKIFMTDCKSKNKLKKPPIFSPSPARFAR